MLQSGTRWTLQTKFFWDCSKPEIFTSELYSKMIKASSAPVSEQNSLCWRSVLDWLRQHNQNECIYGAQQVSENKFSLKTLLHYVLQLPPTAETAGRKIFATDSGDLKIKCTLQDFASAVRGKEGNQVFMVLWIFGLSWLFCPVVMSLSLRHRDILINQEFTSWMWRTEKKGKH